MPWPSYGGGREGWLALLVRICRFDNERVFIIIIIDYIGCVCVVVFVVVGWFVFLDQSTNR